MRVNEEWFDQILSVLRSKHQRKILYLFKDDKAYNYTEVMKMVGYKTSNVFAFHLRALLNAKLVKKENNLYFISRLGIETIKLLDQYKQICMSFDLSDCDADGRVKLMVVRN